ncbi:GNAT family N-acetyltransferase [Pseudarthrobacter sp. J64]|uniref:GNAT family N-acetyltransferase n=1 Tax=Pseudarthrobacter sp. J64 TaxID=3116485 RepID=UPI002E7FD358|nr:GNAT family N-acetyltransferase [Pseudarthrobacter sp. J64]MEE2569657.1 GNAT family N-acetyltransferase [Pseudarthrobacter sp. J64]
MPASSHDLSLAVHAQGQAEDPAQDQAQDHAQDPVQDDNVELPDPQATGLAWRPATSADLDAWAALIARTAAVEQPVWCEKRADLEQVLDNSKNDPRTHTLLGLDGSGVPRAYGRIAKNPDGDKALGMGCVDPQWQRRGIGAAVVAWQEARTKARFAADRTAGQPRLRIFNEQKLERTAALLRRLGYQEVRWYNEMHRPLREPAPLVELGDGLELALMEPVHHEAARLAHNDAFRDHWGSEPRDEQSWRFTLEHPLARPDWTTVVLNSATGEVAGYQVASFDPDTATERGFKEGYTELLGVRRAYRGQGIARALLADAIRRFTADGMDVASLDVDSANPTGALALYLGMGYSPVNQSMSWEKSL